MKRIYIDDSKRRKIPRLSTQGRRTIEYELTSIEHGRCDTERLYRVLDRNRGLRAYWLFADSMVNEAAIHGNVAAMEALLDFEGGEKSFALDALRGLRLKTMEVTPGGRLARGTVAPGEQWAPMPSAYSTTLPIHQAMGAGCVDKLSMLSLLIERHGLEQLHVCMRPGEGITRQPKEVYGGLTAFQRALKFGYVPSAAFMLKEDSSCLNDLTSKGAHLNELLHRKDGGAPLIQGAGAVFMQSFHAAQQARRMVDEINSARSTAHAAP